MVVVRKEECQKDVRKDRFSGLESISSLMNGEDVTRVGGFLFQLSPELGDMSIHRPTHYGSPVPPHFLEEIQPRCHRASPSNERQEKIQLLRSQGNLVSVSKHNAGSDIDPNRPELL